MIEIETRLAHQEHLLGDLNDALTSQQAQISSLETLCRSLLERLREVLNDSPGTVDERPPHY